MHNNTIGEKKVRKYVEKRERRGGRKYLHNNTCVSCGKVFFKLRTNRKPFCSAECYHDYNKGENAGAYKGGRPDVNGYATISGISSKTCYQHRNVMESYIGRKLKKSEAVHHINGDRKDNRIENLLLMSRGEHTSLHMKEYWSKKKKEKAEKEEKERSIRYMIPKGCVSNSCALHM